MGEDFNISGTWINRISGDKVTVRNTFIDGDNMIIQTTDGRQISMNEFQNYIQMSEEEYDAQGHKTGNGQSLNLGNFKQLENERRVTLQSNRKVVDNSFEEPDFGRINNQNIEQTQKTVETENTKLLRKLFEKINLDVDVKVDLDCTNFPKDELKMLQSIYDVSIDDISDYIIKNVINDDVYRNAVSSYIKDQLS